MSDPYQPIPIGPRPVARIDAGRLWAGGVATAIVTALLAATGILIIRGLFGIPVLAPKGAGVWGDATTVRYVAAAALGSLLATGLIQLLVIFTPSPMRFFGWIVSLVTATLTLAPFASGADLGAKLATATLNLVLGCATGTLVAGAARTALRVAGAAVTPGRYGRAPLH